MKLPRIILADDHTMLLDALERLLKGKCEIVGKVTDGHKLVHVALSLKPDIVVMDIFMPLLNGLEAGRLLREKLPALKLIFLTMSENPDGALAAMRAGASAYLLKKSAASELFRAIQDALKGKTYVTSQIAHEMERTLIWDPREKSREKSLTERQREIVRLLAEGNSLQEAADRLKVTYRTIAYHKYRIMRELGIKSSAELFQFAITNKIIEV